MLRTQIYLPQLYLRHLRQEAKKKNTTLSNTIRSLIEKDIRAKQPIKRQNAGTWLLSLAKEAERLKIRGPKDLASNMDKYLYG